MSRDDFAELAHNRRGCGVLSMISGGSRKRLSHFPRAASWIRAVVRIGILGAGACARQEVLAHQLRPQEHNDPLGITAPKGSSGFDSQGLSTDITIPSESFAGGTHFNPARRYLSSEIKVKAKGRGQQVARHQEESVYKIGQTDESLTV